MKHTPGPWQVAGHGNARQELPILRADGNEIACIRGDARLADAKLIAAAPALLRELRNMTFRFEHMDAPEDAEAIETARAAIALATA